MKFSICRQCFLYVLRNIRLSDVCLLIFMGILMIQSVFNLFCHELAGSSRGTIDVIIRTNCAAIFGYFIGAGFLREDIANTEKKSGNARSLSTENIITRKDSTEPTQQEPPSDPIKIRSQQQIIIVATIGIFSLLILVLANNFIPELPAAAQATVSQLRDFVSGSVGLLIGSSVRRKT